ncbi:GH116 family glycosyl-hydrolase [Niabella sp.]|uniref:GH116 family glycosyl-hydrolase n=1 Tax=Niabella sp. TaxID=1962976 RepID=UPI00262358CB|nr:GH116 family glycosyl-hydrolase [Niabella sp.]
MQDRYNISRRNFIRKGSLAGAGLVLTTPAWAGLQQPATSGPAAIHSGTKLTGSLYERSAVTTYLKSKDELKYIGMPVGGINTGGLYLGGDGTLWLWDIFNLNQEGINPLDVPWKDPVHEGQKIRSRDGGSYVAPPKSKEVRLLEQGFAVKLEYEGKTIVRKLDEQDWEEVRFEATYPVATITYTDKALPVEVVMQAFSPFIPLDTDRSGIPATIFNIEIRNKSAQPMRASVAGWLENKAAPYTGLINRLQRKSTAFKEGSTTGIYYTLEKTSFGNQQAEKSFDFGTLCLAALNGSAVVNTDVDIAEEAALFSAGNASEALKAAQQKLMGSVAVVMEVAAGQSAMVPYVLSWHTPNLMMDSGKVLPEADRGRYYDNQFKNAKEVAIYVAANVKELSGLTLLWKDTWYDATLPYWFLDRTFVNIAALASTTSHRFKSGRYWAWEGVGACQGNCTHVWQYAQGTGRIFPAMERDNRERVDLGISLQENGGIWFRGEYDKRPAIDGQAGRVLGCYREHQMSADHRFLQQNWDKIKRATQFIINQDKNKDGMVDTPLENTLDAIWDGEIAWIVGLCIAAVKAGQLMAEEMQDTAFAATCRDYVQKGSRNMHDHLFNGEYFIHRPDPVKGRKNVGSYNTCHIDQVFGQSWAFQVGLGRIIDQKQSLSALRALWKYNFVKDMGRYAETHKGGRPYALYGESGMVMNTNPKNEPKPYGENATWQMGYFHECMSGFEHQVASHMMAEGMTDEAMTLTRAIHDRYHASKRNPFNEIECSDHYGRAMASYGTFITACGFEYHGPKGHIRFAPKWHQEHFKAAFTAAEGWGSYTQKSMQGKQEAVLEVKYGKLLLNSIGLQPVPGVKPRNIVVTAGNEKLTVKADVRAGELQIRFNQPVTLLPGAALKIVLGA